MQVSANDALIACSEQMTEKQLKIRKALGEDVEPFQLPEEWISAVRNGADLLLAAPSNPAGILRNFEISRTNIDNPEFVYAPEKTVSGIGGGDWFWKDYHRLPRIASDSPYSEFHAGKGMIRILAADPFFYPEKLMYQRRERTRTKMLRIYSAVLQNMQVYSSHKVIPDRLEMPNMDLTGKWLFKTDPPGKGISLNWHNSIPDGFSFPYRIDVAGISYLLRAAQ